MFVSYEYLERLEGKKLEMVYFSALINQIITVWVDALQSTPTYVEFLLLLTKIMYIIHRLHTLYLHSK